MAKKLSTVLSETRAAVRDITTDEAKVLVKLGMSGADVNDKARRATNYYLTMLTEKDEIEDDEANVCLDIIKQASTTEQKHLCNLVLSKYVGKLDFAQPKAGKPVKVQPAREDAVAA